MTPVGRAPMLKELAIAADRERAASERMAAVRRIAETLDPDAIIPLAVIYAESEGAVRLSLAAALRTLSATEVAIAQLGAVDPDRRISAVRVLGMLADDAAAPAVIAALDDPDPRVREHAAGALCKLSCEGAIEALAKQLFFDADPDARGAAAQALGELADADALHALEHATKREQDPFVVILIERALHAAVERAGRPRRLAACG